ncbi:MAG: hypothetical protein CL780_04230 [Chloroflexi bacterium]|nr:hypothetical protein [Chloroflexota bacterium]|tara:strand:+ start:675 stop:1124 length:450 start_codon:yes stop_codon:yes gene_type:complete
MKIPKNESSVHKMKKSNYLFVRILWIILGCLFVFIGTVGIFVPGLPTTIFLIIAAACFIRSSEKLYKWLINNKYFGKYIRDYREGKGMPKRGKITAVTAMIIFISLATVPFSPISVGPILIKIIIILTGVIGFWYIVFRVPTLKINLND